MYKVEGARGTVLSRQVTFVKPELPDAHGMPLKLKHVDSLPGPPILLTLGPKV